MAYMKQGQWQAKGELSQLQRVDTFNAFASLDKDRFHLYVSYGCPFAHRAILVIALLGLEEYVSVSSVAPLKGNNGWEFSEEYSDPLTPRRYLYQVYQDAKQDYSGRISVPVLWDKKLSTIVSNDSFEISKWLAKQELSRSKVDLMPEQYQEDIEAQCQWINTNINTLPFKAGFSTNQHEHEEATNAFFENLTVLDNKLAQHQYYHGADISLSDLFIVPTLVQLELVYATHFKMNVQPLSHFKYVYSYLTLLMSDKAICSTFHIDFIKKTYFSA
ncbi:glutathione S-transferase family protein [Shewanella gelidimarina]|uniref:glutathione S-transferase C-terminal domain-containing protein n=1 Tax=Shewanella gelidimarina TaxID=56813 RepID=UPI002010ADEC|nr:glutathione S-transferase C-terminal domain-containing protein [Shewanella gelidimarina]MCL1057506.1 glutathione S-transferase family protein [Shewanella gelidimarina]